jgi:hypothetical protein
MTTTHMEAHPNVWGSGEEISPLRWLSQLGTALLSSFAKVADRIGGSSPDRQQAGDQSIASVPPPVQPVPACCNLAFPNGPFCHHPPNNKPAYTCPTGFYRQWWYCCEGTRQAACAECTTSTTTCWQGTFKCSIWWYTGHRCP